MFTAAGGKIVSNKNDDVMGAAIRIMVNIMF